MTPEDTSKVRSKEELIAFLELVLRDHAQNGKEWENRDIPSFIGALQSWLEDSDGYYVNRKEDAGAISPWRRIADALAAARIYE
jgi:hypothetical protein